MPANFELKAYCGDPRSCEETAIALGAVLTQEVDERELDGDVVVSMHRKTYAAPDWCVNIDRMLGHLFMEIEVFQEDFERAAETMNLLTKEFGVRKTDIFPRSYAYLTRAIERANAMRSLLDGRLADLVLIDGPSGAGKSTLVHGLRQNLPDEYRFLRRYTSRPERPGDADTNEYIHISVAEFQQMAHEGAFIESKDFLFDMSYGISWQQAVEALQDPGVKAAYGLMNLGNIRYVKEFAPEIRRVLITAPLDDLRQRLIGRGTHTQEALDERLENARMANEAEDLYDVVIWNSDGCFESSLEQLINAVKGSRSNAVKGSRS